ncbi:MAG: hypothetical protein ABIR33_02040 [Pyrinomonadaceae bacterium]
MKLKLIALLFLSLAFACSIQSKQKQGDEIIAKVEQFKIRERRLPKSLNEVGVPESEDGPLYYRQLSESHYELWCGSGLGESVTYDSDRKTWK